MVFSIFFLDFAYLNVEIRFCCGRQLFTFVAGTAFLILVDGTKQARLVVCSSFYWSTLHLRIIIPEQTIWVHVCMFYTLIVVIILACYYNATTFAANRQPLLYKYGQIGPILFLKNMFILLLKLETVVCFGSLL